MDSVPHLDEVYRKILLVADSETNPGPIFFPLNIYFLKMDFADATASKSVGSDAEMLKNRDPLVLGNVFLGVVLVNVL